MPNREHHGERHNVDRSTWSADTRAFMATDFHVHGVLRTLDRTGSRWSIGMAGDL
jgi:hypothetical protein